MKASIEKIFAMVLFFACILAGASEPSESLFDTVFRLNLLEQNKQELKTGKTITIKTKSTKKLVLAPFCPLAEKQIELLKDFGPNYLSEIVAVIPYKDNEELPQKMKKVIDDVPSYKGIPYWSEHHERYWELYSECRIVSQKQEADVTTINAMLEMEPFGDIDTTFTTEALPDSFFYQSMNNNDLYAKGIKCIKKGKMQTVIAVYRYEDFWVLYGAGGIDAMKLPFFTSRIETSIMNRIRTFCNFVFEKI